TALALSGMRSRKLFGVDLSLRREATVADFMRHQANVAAHERRHREEQMRSYKVEMFHGAATFVDANTVRVAPDTLLRGEKILIATGSSPMRPSEFPFEHSRVHDSDEILEIGAPPLAATGIEQARMAMCIACEVDYKDVVAPILPTGIYTIPEASMAGETEDSLKAKGVAYVVGRARYMDNPRGQIVGDESGLLKLIFSRNDMRLLGVHVVGEQATELVHIGLVAMMSGSGAELFNRTCFNYPTLGDLYKYATYEAILKRDGVVADERK